MPGPSSPLSGSHRRDLIDSLWDQTIDARYATIKTAHARTCEWLLKKTEYQDWLDINKTHNHHGIFWIKGKPGSGKSTLVKFAVANAQKTRAETAVISFFFNARGEDLEKSTLGMYRSLLYQLLEKFPDLQTVLGCLRLRVPREGEIYRWKMGDLQNLFTAAIQGLGQRRLMCFIDALDECEEDQIRDLVAFLENLGRLTFSSRIHFHVCLSSRHYPHISIENGVQLILEDQEDHIHDITKYLNGTLKAGRGKQAEVIKEELLQRSSGVFLWVVLVVQILNKEYDHGRIHALRKRLREIPDGLEKLFEEILTRDQKNMEELILCFQWILYAKHPLKREEVYYAILSGTDPEVQTSTNSEAITTEDMNRFILSCSKGLAETTRHKKRTVQFIHESVREFLLGKNGFNKLKLELGFGLSQDRLKQCCYNCMTIDTSEYLPPSMVLPPASSEEAKGLRELVSKKLPFLDYAVRNVLYHANVADGQGISQKAFVERFALSKWILLDNLFEKFQIRRHTSRASLLYILAEKNFSNLIRIQPELGLGSDTAVERYGTPLGAALANGTVDKNTIQALLIPKLRVSNDHGELHNADSDSERECSRSAINIIVEKRPDLNPRKGETLMHWAASGGHEAVVNMLLSNANLNADVKDKDNRTPLSYAAAIGHDIVVNLLFSKGADPDSKDKDNRTPLSYAASGGSEAMVNWLLSKPNLDPDSKDKDNRTPLSYAAANGHEIVVNLLLSKNADPDSKDKDDRTPLSYAVINGDENIVNLLLSKGADPDSKDKDNRTPLSYAAANGHEIVVNLLLSEGVDPDSNSSSGHTPLLYAALYGHRNIVKLLLSKGADPDSKDKDNRTPLSYAAVNGHEIVVNLLLSEGVDPDSKDSDGSTPLLYAALYGHGNIVKLLLSKGVDPDSSISDGCTPLLWAALNGHETIVDLLFSKGVDPDSKDSDGRTPLSQAAFQGHGTVINLLLSKGVDPDSKDRNGRTPLLWAASSGHETIVDLLLSKGANPDSKDKWGRTPLSVAMSNNREGIIKLLRANVKTDPNDKDAHD